MYIDITEFFRNAFPADYQASVMELGANAGRITWAAAIDDAPDYPLLDTDEKRQAFREFIRQSGGSWSENEINGWSETELTALLIQFIAGDMRTFNELADGSWETWSELVSEGIGDGRLFGGPLSVDGRVYYYLGS